MDSNLEFDRLADSGLRAGQNSRDRGLLRLSKRDARSQRERGDGGASEQTKK